MANWISIDYAPMHKDVLVGWSGDGSSFVGWFEVDDGQTCFVTPDGFRMFGDDMPDLWAPFPTPPINPDGNKRGDSEK